MCSMVDQQKKYCSFVKNISADADNKTTKKYWAIYRPQQYIGLSLVCIYSI